MNRLVRIDDELGRVFVPLSQILVPLAPEARELQWSVLDLGEVLPGEGLDLPDPYTEPRVVDSPSGWALTFDELTAFAAWVGQVIDGIFVGCSSPRRLPSRSDSDAELLEQADMLVAAIDSSFWVLSAPDRVLSRVEQAFQRVSDLAAGSVQLSTWGRDY
jgi:hypothetical protein